MKQIYLGLLIIAGVIVLGGWSFFINDGTQYTLFSGIGFSGIILIGYGVAELGRTHRTGKELKTTITSFNQSSRFLAIGSSAMFLLSIVLSGYFVLSAMHKIETVKDLEEAFSDQNIVLSEKNTAVFLSRLLKIYSSAHTRQLKEWSSYSIATMYDLRGQREDAAKYYRLSASHMPFEGEGYYEALASAEWSIGNATSVKQIYEEGIKRYPNGYSLLNAYGVFLLGLSKGSVGFQDLQRALEINNKSVELSPDDANLQNLYANLLLLNKAEDAELLKSKFEDFDTNINYAWLARTYHRMKNEEKSEYFLQLAKEKGYELTAGDRDFFEINF